MPNHIHCIILLNDVEATLAVASDEEGIAGDEGIGIGHFENRIGVNPINRGCPKSEVTLSFCHTEACRSIFKHGF